MTTQSKHTPAPWYISPNSNPPKIRTEKKTLCQMMGRTNQEYSRNEMDANAQLIAAAPELLDALELALSKDMLSGEVADKAREAIDKVRG